MTQVQAIRVACTLARTTGRTHYVVWDVAEDGHAYQVTDDEGLETFHAGISDRNILFCTDGE